MKKLPDIWDCHVHLFTPEMAADPALWARQNREFVWGACVAPPDRPSIQGWADVDQLVWDMDRAGIETVVLQGWYWETMEVCRLQNRFYAKLIDQYPDRIRAFAAVQPCDYQTRDELNWAKDRGFTGIGEIHPQAQGFSLGDACWQAVLDQIRDWNWVVNFHVTDPDTRDHPGKLLTPLPDYLDLAESWPEQAFILSHLGALIPLRPETSARANSVGNLFYDCAAIPLLYDASTLKMVVDAVDSEKLLFGTDYPLRVFPRIQIQPDFSSSVQFVRESGLTEAQLHRVFTDNAKRLFRV